MKVFIDSNIWLRFLLKQKSQFPECQRLFEAVDDGLLSIFTSNIVLLEVNYVLRSVYKFPQPQVAEDLQDILLTRNLKIVEKTNSPQALESCKKYNLKFGDCLIATQVPPQAIFCTFDQDFQKFPNLIVKTPAEILSQLK